MLRLELRADWTSEEYAGVVRSLERLRPADGEEVVVGWEGQAPSLWQLAWVAECVRRLREERITWRWACSGEQGSPGWLSAGGMVQYDDGGQFAG